MTLLSSVRNVCAAVGLFPLPSAVANNTGNLTAQFLALANREIKKLSQERDWPVLVTEYAFPTVNGQASYNLPADFDKVINDTAWNRDAYYQLRGGMTAAEWQYYKSGQIPILPRYGFRVSGTALKLTPTPTAAENLVIEYRSKYYVVDNNGAAKAEFTMDTDSPRVAEALFEIGLQWRIKHAKGLDYGEDLVEYEGRVAKLYAEAIALPSIVSSRLDLSPITDGYVRPNGFGS